MRHSKTAINSIVTRIVNTFPAIVPLMSVCLAVYFAIALFIFWVKNAAVITKKWAWVKKLKTAVNALFPISLKIMTILSKR